MILLGFVKMFFLIQRHFKRENLLNSWRFAKSFFISKSWTIFNEAKKKQKAITWAGPKACSLRRVHVLMPQNLYLAQWRAPVRRSLASNRIAFAQGSLKDSHKRAGPFPCEVSPKSTGVGWSRTLDQTLYNDYASRWARDWVCLILQRHTWSSMRSGRSIM